ncbi:MAG TPA: hypothetical protein VG738_04425 [Chitinophagaceae bacterium]|nr:hypothetical protein [Chitinophagaceae bacterium]
MKPNFVFYRLITFILLPIAGLNAISIIGTIPAALGNPLMLIGVFINFAIIAYTFTSFIFFIRGILSDKPQKASLKDWIKVNAFVTIFYSGFILLAAAIYLSSPQMQKMAADNYPKLKEAMGPQAVDKETFLKFLHWGLIFFGGYSALLLTHVIITLRLLKKYASLFVPGSNNSR